MTVLRIFLAVAWLTIAYVTIRAVSQLGVAGGNIFFGDFSQPWRAQFNTDFGFHLLLMAGWISIGKSLLSQGCYAESEPFLWVAFFRWRTSWLRLSARKVTPACSFWGTTHKGRPPGALSRVGKKGSKLGSNSRWQKHPA
jgi:hypothetical protein